MVDVYLCVAMARRDAVFHPNHFDPELDPEGEAPEEAQTLRLQQHISEWLVCLNNVFTVTTKLHCNVINIKLASNAIA